MGGGHALVQLVKDGGQHHFQASHGEVNVEVHGVDAVLSESLDDIPNVNQVHWRANGCGGGGEDVKGKTSSRKVVSAVILHCTHCCISSAQISACRPFCTSIIVWSPNPEPLRNNHWLLKVTYYTKIRF